MKTKLFKRMATLLMACIMLFAFSATAFASENFSEATSLEEKVMPRGSSSVPAGGQVEIEVGSVNIFNTTPTLTIVTASTATSGNIKWILCKGSNQVYDGYLGVNNMLERPVSLATGSYTLKVTNLSNRAVTVSASFTK